MRLSLAGFQVIMYGRFWVITEEERSRSFRPHRQILRSSSDSWDEHFKLDGPEPLTAIVEVTARILRLNAAERVIERWLLQALGQYRKI